MGSTGEVIEMSQCGRITGIGFSTAYVDRVVKKSFELSKDEAHDICGSLSRNGLAVIRNFIDPAALTEMQKSAYVATERGFSYGKENGCKVLAHNTPYTQEFSQPFLLSAAAGRLVTSHAILDVIETVMGDKAIIHHSLFQRSLPTDNIVLDWHIDTGSNKILNGRKKFADHRIRMIVYLSDVTTGGFSYIIGSSKVALSTFYPLPVGQLFPENSIPDEHHAPRVTVNAPAGSVVLFDTHGLHRPEAPKTERLVLNTWFARRDFSAQLPSILVSLNTIPEAQRDRVYVFDNQRGFDPVVTGISSERPQTLVRRAVRKVGRALANY